MEFEWDPDKAAANLRKHGVSFLVATQVFFDEHALFEDDLFSRDEYRQTVTGWSELGILLVVFTERREDVVRIISAREATPHERRQYRPL
ncbi:BrnT family toxin [Brevundimonas sp. GCM10030266]|uniref:BrnT family toxin n=1 Tax=Brevundimonas sp. GCM10030266 TaxID=3273386 RepID=UPI0036190221